MSHLPVYYHRCRAGVKSDNLLPRVRGITAHRVPHLHDTQKDRGDLLTSADIFITAAVERRAASLFHNCNNTYYLKRWQEVVTFYSPINIVFADKFDRG